MKKNIIIGGLFLLMLWPMGLWAQVTDWNQAGLQGLLDACVAKNLDNVLPAGSRPIITQTTPHSIDVLLSAPMFIKDTHSANLAGRTIVYNILQYVFSMNINTQVQRMEINCQVQQDLNGQVFVYGIAGYSSDNDVITWEGPR